jgi:hypothetical protein
MAAPAIIWRNPKSILRRRLWNRARRDEHSSLYIVVRSGESSTDWEGMPNLEIIHGGGRKGGRLENASAQSRA